MKLEEVKKLQNVFKWNLHKILREQYKSKGQGNALQDIKLPHKAREAVIKLFNDYCLIASEAKYKATHGKERLSELLLHPKILTLKSVF